MCVQYRGGCSVPWGVFSTVGGSHEYRGGISWVPWGCSVPWGDIMINVGGYLEYRGGCSVPWGVFSTVGDIMSTVGGYLEYRGGYHDACGGYHEYRGGCSVPWGEKSFVIWVPHGTHDIPPHVSWYPPHVSWYPPTVLKFQRMVSPTVLNIPHSTHDIPPRASWYPPRYWTSPTVLKITPHGTHDIPHGTEHPQRYSRYPPTFIMISPMVLNHGTQDIPPRYSWYPPRYWTPPRYWAPPRYCTHIIQGGSRRGKWGFSSKDRKESNSTEARTENAGVRINLLMG